MQDVSLSFIIPAFNEEKEIARTLKAISSATENLDVQIIVVDNLSTDRTASICHEYGTTVVTSQASTIGGVRNDGVERATGKFLVFIDADVSLAPNWGDAFLEAVRNEATINRKIFGSRCSPPFSDYISRGWFSKIRTSSSTYINSGHLIIARSFFEEIGGFRPDLVTAEDVELCKRAKQLGAEILEIDYLTAYHYGFPKSFFEFVKREAWHGYQDFSSFKDAIKSKTALASTLTVSVFLLLLALGLSTSSIGPILLSIFIFVLNSIVFYFLKTKNLKDALFFWPIASAYLVGRFVSLALRLNDTKAKSPRSIS